MPDYLIPDFIFSLDKLGTLSNVEGQIPKCTWLLIFTGLVRQYA
jgi:hypothetical protein